MTSNELSPWLNDLESAHERIEERITQLEAIVSTIQRRETTTTTPVSLPSNEQTAGVIHERSRERHVESDKTYLISKALNMEKTTSSVSAGYFDCNICLRKADAPVLTCCGHLFCWRCFYQLPLVYLNIKECPVCDGEVMDTEVIPIYGNGDSKGREDCSIVVPPRPSAKKVESVRQKIVNRGIPFIPVHETLEHIRRTIDSISLQALAQGDEFGLSNIITNGGQQQDPLPAFRPLRLIPPFAAFPGLVVDTSDTPSPPPPPPAPFDDDFVDTTSLRRNRRRSLRIAEIGPSPAVRASMQRNQRNNGAISFGVGPASSSSTTEFAVPSGSSTAATRSQTVNPTEVVTAVTSASSSRRRTDDVSSGPRTRSRRRLS